MRTLKLRIKRPADIIPRDVVIDSAGLPSTIECHRVDHHIDNGWTNVDSVARTELGPLRQQDIDALVTIYLDPDAIISAALLSMALEQRVDVPAFLESDLGKVMYSASFYSDYGIGFGAFSDDINSFGNKLELLLRDSIDRRLGEDRWRDPVQRGESHSAVFDELTSDVIDIIEKQALPQAAISFENETYLKKMKDAFLRYVRLDICTEHFGLIHIIGAHRRIIPRAYFGLFEQPIIVRVIQRAMSDNEAKQVFIGVNPLITGWESLNLEKLGSAIASLNKDWSLDGRRFVIGMDGQHRAISELMEILIHVDPNDIIDDCSLWTVYP